MSLFALARHLNARAGPAHKTDGVDTVADKFEEQAIGDDDGAMLVMFYGAFAGHCLVSDRMDTFVRIYG